MHAVTAVIRAIDLMLKTHGTKLTDAVYQHARMGAGGGSSTGSTDCIKAKASA